MLSFSWINSSLSFLSSRWFYDPSSSSSLSIQNSNSTQIALQNCITRIKLAIQQVKLELLNEQVSKLNCPIAVDFPKNPVVTNCGHIFDRANIQQWKDLGKPCALCRRRLTQFTPVPSLKGFIEDLLPDPVVTCSNFTSLNKPLATQCFKMAKNRIDENDYEGGLGFLTQALRYTNLSDDYAIIPEIYNQLGSPEKALLSRLFLSLYQLQEGKIQEAIETLKLCDSKDVNLNPIVVVLTLESCQSSEAVELAMFAALNQTKENDRIFIYKEIIACAPKTFEAYKQLIPLTKDREEQKTLLLQAADLAHNAQQFDLEADFRHKAEASSFVASVISKEEWANAQAICLPPYPQELKDFLDAECTIWPGKKRSETHIVVPLFPEVTFNENEPPIPLTLESLDQLDKSSGGPGYRFFMNQIPKDIPAEKKFHYAVMTCDVIPETRYKPYDEQLDQLPTGYKVPGAFDVARALLWENRRSGKRCLNENPWTFTRCKEVVLGNRLNVGGFESSGLRVDYDFYYDFVHECIGIAGWRDF